MKGEESCEFFRCAVHGPDTRGSLSMENRSGKCE